MRVYVRNGHAGDIPWMLKQLKEFSEFFGSEMSLYGDDASAEKVVEGLMERGLVLVAEKPGPEHLGFIVGAITPHLFNPNILVLAELLWWVDPAYRKTRAGYLLLLEFVAWGKKNADWITFALEEGSPVREEALTRQGFRRTERSYLIEVGCKNGSSNNGSSGGRSDSDSGRDSTPGAIGA